MRRVLTASILALAAFGLLLAGTGAANAQDQAGGLDGTFFVAPSRPGDRALYALSFIALEDTDGGWGWDAEATLEVERLGDRVLPIAGQPQAVSSFASTWVTSEIDWMAWAGHWGMSADDWEEAAEDYEEAAEEWEDANEEWEEDGDYEEMEEWEDEWGEFADLFGQLFGSRRIQGEPWHVAHVDATQRVVATTHAGADADLPGSRLVADLGLDTATTVLTTFGPSTVPCGFHSDLQAGVVPLSQKIKVSGHCPPAGGHFGTAPDNLTSDRFVAVGHDLVRGEPAVVYGHESGAANMRLWFTQDVPYPIRILTPVELYKDYPVLLLYEMTEFEPGTLQAAEPPQALALAPRLASGPDATGVEHPFPLAVALEAARADQQDTSVGEFLAEHPDAAIDEARFLRLRDGEAEMERWTFTLIAGGDAMHVTATRGAPPEPPESGETDDDVSRVTQYIPPGTIPAGTLPAEVDDGVVVEGTAGSSSGRVSLVQLPSQLPKVADVLALWHSDGAGGGIPAWAFHLRPDGSSWLAVGSAEATTVRDQPGDTGETTLEYSFYGVGPDGSFLFSEESPTRAGYDVPQEDDPDATGADYDVESDDSFTSPNRFMLASVGYWAFPETKTTATVGAAAGLVGILAYALLPAKYGALGLFSRIGNGQVLEHPLRAQISSLVEAEPGIHFQELVRRLDAGRGTMEHHLRKLVAANVLTMQVSQGFTCFFPKGKVDRHLMAAAPVLKSGGARQVLQCIQEQPGRAAQDVAAATGLTPSTVNYHLKRLAQSGLVSSERSGRFTLLTPTPLGTQALGAWGRT
jgi:predicted transcriptional regulator